MGVLSFLENLMFAHSPDDSVVTIGPTGHLLLTDVKFRAQLETFLCASAAAATVGGGTVAVYNWAENRRKEKELEAMELATAS